MKKVLIISYYAPPCNLTSAQRIGSWIKYLPENGFYPIVVTRNWTGKELNEKTRLSNSGDQVNVLKKENSEIHFMPYKSSWRDTFFMKSDKILFRYISKSLTLLQIFLRNFTIRVIPYVNLYQRAQEILREDKSIEYCIISVDPFEQLHFGHLLNKEFPHIKWIADYRDDWTTSDIDYHPFRKLQAYFEQKWVNSAAAVISVSPYYTEKIAIHTNRQGYTIFNGFDYQVQTSEHQLTKDFLITYNGSLYDSQPIELFLSGFKKFVLQHPKETIHLHFPGLALSGAQKKRVENLLIGFEKNVSITDRQPREAVLQLQIKSDLLLMVAHQNLKGIPSSKVFEYIGLKKSFIVCPGDKNVLDFIANSSSLGTVLDDEHEVFEFLEKKLQEKHAKKTVIIDENAIQKFSVQKQVRQLSKILSNLI